MGHQDQIGGAFYKLRGKHAIVVFRADPYTDAADRGVYPDLCMSFDVRVGVCEKKNHLETLKMLL